MSQDYGQIPIPDSNSLLRENNTLRLTIDSLHEELQSLKFKSATPQNPFLETQLISLKSENQQLINERNHLIKQLQSPRLSETSPDGMGRLREKLESLLDENKRLGDMVIDLKQRNAHLETHQVNRSSSHYREDENNALQSKLALLAAENERLNRLVQEREREIDSSVGNSSAKVVILELENKIVVLSAENERLNAVVNDRNREIETLQLKLSSMGSHHGQGNDRYEGLLSEIERLNHLLHDREREIEEYRVQRGSERYSHYSRGEGEKRAGRYDTESSHGGVDVDRRIREAEMQRDDLSREVEAWKEKYKNVLKETKQPEQYENEVKRLRGEVEKLKVSLEIKTKQLSEYESHHNKYLNAGDAEKKIDALVHENERVNTLLNEKKKEMAALQKRVEGYGGVEDKIIGLVTENQRIVKSLNEKTKECEIWREKYVALEGGDHANPLDVEKRVKAIETESDRTRGMYNEKTREIEGLKKRLREAGNQIESWKEKFYERDSAFLKHSQTNNRLEAKVKSMGEENDKLNKILEEKVKMVSELQVKIYSVTDIEARAKAFTQERERLEALVARQKDDLLQMTEKSVRLDIVDKRLKETEKQLSLLLKENEELKVMVRDREQEIAEGRNIIEELEDKTNKVYKLEEMLEILARDNEKNAMEIEDKKRETKEWKDKVKDLQGRNMRVAELETRIELMASENERIAGLLKRKEKMLEESQDLRGLSHQGGKRELEETVRWLAEENEGLKDDCERKGREVDMLKSRLETRERESLRRETGQSQVRASIVETENATLKQIIKEREEEIKRWRVKCETSSKYTEGERELLDKLRTLQSENGDLKGSVAEKNIVIQDIVRKNNELEEMQERFQRVASEKVLLSAEVERLREDVTLLRKEKELMERKELLSGRTSDYNALSSGKYNRSSDRTEEMGKMIDELVKENTKLESVIIRLERELEYHKKKSLEYEKVEVYLATLQGKLDLLAEENNRLTEKMKEYKDQSERLSQRLKEKDREIQGVSVRFGSSGEANYGYGHHLDSLHSEGDRFNALKSPTGGLDKGYSGLGIYESKSYGNADYGIKQYSAHKDSPSHLKNDKSNDNFRASRIGAAGDVAIDKIYTGMHSDSMKILQDANLDLLKQTLEQQEKDIMSIRGSNIHVDKEYNFTGKNEGKSYDF